MPILLGIIGIVLLYIFWDYIIYIIGGTLILVALLCVWLAIDGIQDAKLSPDEWQKKEQQKKEKNPQYKPFQKQPSTKSGIKVLIIAILFGTGGYKIIDYNSNRIETNQIAEKQEKERKYEEQRLADEKELNDKISSLNEKEKAIYDNYYKAAINEGTNEFQAKQISLRKMNEQIDKENAELQKKYDDQAKYEEWLAWQKAEEEKKAAEEQKKVEAAEKAAAEKRRKENTISIGDPVDKVERLKGKPHSIHKNTSSAGTILSYLYYKNGYDHSAGTITYYFSNYRLSEISESN